MVSNLADLVAQSAAERPDAPALLDGRQEVSYAALDDQITAVAAGLLARGVRRGDRVALLVGNQTGFVTALFGAMRAGAIAVPLNTSAAPAEIEHAIEVTGATVLVCDQQRAADAARADLGACLIVGIGTMQWQALLNGGDANLIPVERDAEAPALLLFTAGSTGTPKPAILSHRALASNVDAVVALRDPAAVVPGDRVLAVLPLFHVYSLNAVLTAGLAAGATIVLSDRFSPRETLEVIRSSAVTVVAGAPPMYVAWSREPDLREALESVRLLTSGAAPLPAELFEHFSASAGMPIWEGYGLTECAPVVTTSLVSGTPRPGSVGAPLPGVEVRVVEGQRMPPAVADDEDGGTGEIWVRAPSLFSGYWPDGHDGPNDDGWYATGDVGYFDHLGDLHLVNRRSDLILVSGFNVYPREVEDVVNSHEAVAECAVLGVPHPYSGEAVKALVVLRPGLAPDAVEPEDIVRWCEQRLARYKCPTIVAVVSELPHAATGKIMRAKLRAV